MNSNKLALHQATMTKNLPGATKCMDSVFSAIVLNLSIPFTRDDLHQLNDYDKALYKATIEKNDNFSDGTKERKKREIEILFSEAEMSDMYLMPSDVYFPHQAKPSKLHDNSHYFLYLCSLIKGCIINV